MASSFGGRRFYTLSVGEKGVFRFNCGTRARRPRLGPRARRQRVAQARAAARARCAPSPSPSRPRRASSSSPRSRPESPSTRTGSSDALERLGELDPLLAAFVAEPMLRVTLTPTRARASEQGQRDPVARPKSSSTAACRRGWTNAHVRERSSRCWAIRA